MTLTMGQRYVHVKSGNVYVLHRFVKMKRPDNGEWVEGVLYHRDDGSAYLKGYVCTKESFEERFEGV